MTEPGELCTTWSTRPGPDHHHEAQDAGQEREDVTPTVGGHLVIVAPRTTVGTQLIGAVQASAGGGAIAVAALSLVRHSADVR